LRRHVFFAIVPATAFVAVAVALSLRARADRIEAEGPNTTPTLTPTATPPAKFRVLTTVPIPTNAHFALTVNQALNKIYTSGGASCDQGEEVFVIDGTTFATIFEGVGSGVSVDNKTNRYWAARVCPLFEGGFIVRDGDTNVELTDVTLGFCPISTTYDFKYNRVWVGAQCGFNNDPVFAVDAATFEVITPDGIGSGGIMGPIVANGVNGRLYMEILENGVEISKRVDPTTFAVTVNAFGIVRAINTVTNKLYAVPEGTNNLQIINGTPDPEVILKTIRLPYSPGSMGVNTALNYLYIANPAGNSLEVRDPSTGALITIFTPLPATPDGPLAVDSIRGRIYIISFTPSSQLMVIEDLINAFKPGAIISHF
jgi:DNA-binding beta-propeller fold protein YncE